MRKFLSQVIRIFVVSAIVLCGISCASTGSSAGEANDKLIESYKKAIVGNWFWNYGYDQTRFANEQGIFNKDGTFELFYIVPEESEYDKGDYYIINDEKYGPTLQLHLKQWKNKLEDDWQDTDVKIYFTINSIDDDRLLMSRYRRDFTGIGWIVQDFDPGVYNDYRKIKDSTKETLVGKWTVNKRGTPGIDWDETWVFNADGTMEDYWRDAGEEPVKYKGKYEVIEEKTGSVLHTTLTSGQNESGAFELNPPMEFWTDYKTCGENLIKVRSLRNIIGGEKHNSERDSDDFYYREIPLETVTYHWENYTFKDYYPKGEEYKTIGLEKRFLFRDVPDDLMKQHFIGWCDNSELSGNLVEKIAAGDSSANYEFWAKWGLKCNRNDYDPQNGNYNHEFTLPLSLLAPNMKLPSTGDKVKVVLSGKLSKDIDCWWGLRIVDNSDGWYVFGEDWHNIKSNNGSFTDIFEITTSGDSKTTDYDQLFFNLCYNPDSLDETITIDDYKFEVIDENSSIKIIEHTFNYGNFIFKQNSVLGYDFYLPTNPDNLPYQTNYWTQQGNEFLGWYDNPEFKGNPITKLSGNENNKSKTFYGKYNLKFSEPNLRDNGSYGYDRKIPVKAVIPNAKLNPKKGDVVRVAVSAKASKDFEVWMGMDLINISPEWNDVGNDWHHVESKNKMLKACFEIPIQKDANYNSIDDAVFCFMYDTDTATEPLILSDFKFEFVDKDPFVTTEAESKHVSIKPCAEGFEITVRKLDSDVGDWTGHFNLYTGDIKTNGYDTNVNIDSSILNDKKTVTFIWPFCEKGKTYRFDYSWNDSKWHGEYLKVIATTGKGELNVKPLEKMKITLESNSKEANLSVKNFSKEMIMDVVQKYINQIATIDVDLPVVSGKNDWSDTRWLFGAGCIMKYSNQNQDKFYSLLQKAIEY
ncbi:MAG: hypothetical protein K6G09_11470, partial [Treponema sp.]|nr:hypothetical protein [Treponema sp.]